MQGKPENIDYAVHDKRMEGHAYRDGYAFGCETTREERDKLAARLASYEAALTRISELKTAPIGPFKTPAHIAMEAKRIARKALEDK